MWRIALITSGTVADRSERSACNEESTDSSLAHGSYCVLCRDLEQDLLGELLCTINVLSYASLNYEGETPSRAYTDVFYCDHNIAFIISSIKEVLV